MTTCRLTGNISIVLTSQLNESRHTPHQSLIPGARITLRLHKRPIGVVDTNKTENVLHCVHFAFSDLIHTIWKQNKKQQYFEPIVSLKEGKHIHLAINHMKYCSNRVFMMTGSVAKCKFILGLYCDPDTTATEKSSCKNSTEASYLYLQHNSTYQIHGNAFSLG